MDPLRRAFRGYEPAQVDALIADLRVRAEGLEREVQVLRAENQRLSDELGLMRTKCAELAATEDSVKSALVSAHLQASEVLDQARKESETLLQVARETSARLQEDLRGRIDDLNWQIERLSLQKQHFHDDFRALLEGHLAELTEGPAQAGPRPGGHAAVSHESGPAESVPHSEPLETSAPADSGPLPAEPSIEFKS